MPPKKPRSGEQVYSLDHARHERAHCLTPGLFRSMKNGKPPPLHVTYEYSDGRRIEFRGPEALGVAEMRVLQGLVAMAGPDGLILHADEEPNSEIGQQLQLRLFSEPAWRDSMRDAVVVKGSYRQLAREIGHTHIESYRSIRSSIERLWMVSIIVEQDGRREGHRLLSHYRSDEMSGHLAVGLNPLIAQAVFGRTSHIRIDMNEARAIKSDQGRLLHQRLSGYINVGSEHPSPIGIDTLCSYVWPDPPTSDSAQRMRRKRIRTALDELRKVGWSVRQAGKDRWKIGRPKPD